MQIPRILGMLIALAGPLGAAEPMFCTDPIFRVEADTEELAMQTCDALARARTTLESCAVALETPLEIAVTERVDGEFGPCLGVYHCGEDRIEVLSPEAMSELRETDGAFGPIPDAAYWESVLVHELTHAAYDRVKCPFTSCVATTEYAAYAMQVHSLPPEQQARFGQTVPLKGDVDRSAISAMMYFMSPDRFAKYAWLHFKARPDPCGYMSQIMDGKIFFDREPL
jgi:hypothetical protein